MFAKSQKFAQVAYSPICMIFVFYNKKPSAHVLQLNTKVTDSIRHELKVARAASMKSERVHRLGPKRGTTRPIAAKLSSFKEREVCVSQGVLLFQWPLWLHALHCRLQRVPPGHRPMLLQFAGWLLRDLHQCRSIVHLCLQYWICHRWLWVNL